MWNLVEKIMDTSFYACSIRIFIYRATRNTYACLEVLRRHDIIPRALNLHERLRRLRCIRLRSKDRPLEVVSLAAERRLREEVNFCMVAGLRAVYRHLTTELDPRHAEDRACIG